jgi:hypothetical protein
VVINDVGIITLPADSAIGGHLALAVFVINGARASSMEQTIARIAGASYEFFTGETIAAARARRAVERRTGVRLGPRGI